MPGSVWTPLSGVVITASGVSPALGILNTATVNLELVVTAVGGTTPSLTVAVQWSDNGVDFAAVDTTPDTFAAITAAGNVVKQFAAKGPYFRLVYTVTGTTPTFTLTVMAS